MFKRIKFTFSAKRYFLELYITTGKQSELDIMTDVAEVIDWI